MRPLNSLFHRWHGVAVWKWDVNEDVCGICRLAFDACCPDCTVPGDNCSPGRFIGLTRWSRALAVPAVAAVAAVARSPV